MASKIPAEVRKQQRNQIIEAASELFAQQGFEDTSIWDIAERVRLSDAQVLRFFGMKKANILIEIFRRSWYDINTAVRGAAADQTINAKQKLLLIYQHMLQWIINAGNHGVVFILQSRMTGAVADKLVRSGLHEFALTIDDIIQEGQREGIFHPHLNVQALRQQIIGGVENIALGWLLKDRTSYTANYSLDDALDVFNTLLDSICIKDSSSV